MAITVLGTTGGATSNGGTTTISLTGLSLLENDVVVVCGGYGNAVASDPGPSSAGWSELQAPIQHAANNTVGGVWGKRMGASPDASVVMLGSGSSSFEAAYCVVAFRDTDQGVILDVAVVTANGGNPPAVVPITDLSQVIAFVLAQAGTATGAPSGYSNFEFRSSGGGTWTCRATLATKEVSPAASENPGTFTWSSGPTTAQSFSVAIRAATAVTRPGAPNLSESHGDDWAQLVTTAFEPHPDDPTDTHQSSDWQITTNADTTFSSPVIDVNSVTDLLAYLADGTLSVSTAYRARARHVGEAFDGDWSNVVTFTTSAALTKPATPSLTFVDDGTDYIEVSISAFSFPSEASAFHASSEVQIRLASDPDWTTPLETQEAAFTGDASSRVFQFTGLTQNTAYKLRGRELDGYTGAWSNYSADLSETTDATPAQAPLQPTLTIVSCGRDISVTGSAFAHSASGTHASSQWRICAGSSCSSIVSTTSLLAFTWENVQGSATVSLSVRYRDNAGAWGPYSAVAGPQQCAVPEPVPNAYFTAPTDRVLNANTLVEWEFYDPTSIGYHSDIELSSDGATFSTVATDQVGMSTTFTIAGKANGRYTYRVRGRHPTTDETGEWVYLVLILDRTGIRSVHYHFADFDPGNLPGEQIWSDDTHVIWALRDEFDPVEEAEFRLGLLATNVHSGSTTRRSGWIFPELGEPDEFVATATFEHVPGECEWFPYRFANAFVTLGGLMFSGLDTDAPGGQSGNATMMDVGIRPWYLGAGMSCASQGIQDQAVTVSAQYAIQHPTNSYRYARSFSQGILRVVNDRANSGTLTQASTSLPSSTAEVGGPFVYTDEQNILGRGRQLYTIVQEVTRGVSGGNTGRFVKTQLLGAGIDFEQWHREEFVRDTDSSGRVLPCGSCGLAFSDLDQGGVGRSLGILFTDFTLQTTSYGDCVPAEGLTGCEADWDFTLMQRDDVTPYYGNADNEGNVAEADFYERTSCPRPYLKVPSDFSASEIEFQSGSGEIGAIAVEVVDKRLVASDQRTGIVTAIIHDIVGHRAVLRRWREDLGMVTVFDGVVESWSLDERLVTYRFNLRDPRERERNVELFTLNETFALYPDDGPIEPYGQIGDSGYLISPAQPQDAVEFTRFSDPGGDDGVHWGLIGLSERTHDYLENLLYPHGASVYNAVEGRYQFPDITVRWRPAAGGNWTYLRNMPSGFFAAGGQIVDNAIIPPSPAENAQWQLFMSSLVSADIPDSTDLIDVQILAARTSADTPFFWDGGTFGDLLLAVYRGDFTASAPNIRYSQTALEQFALDSPRARFIARAPAKNLREWVQEHIYAPIGYAPSFDADMRIMPVAWELPPSGEELVELDSDWIIPSGDFGHEMGSVVNKVSYTYITESVLPAESRIIPFLTSLRAPVREYVSRNVPSAWMRLIETPTTRVYPFVESMELLGTKDIEYEPLTVRAMTGLLEILLAVFGVDTAQRISDRIGNNVIKRFGWGAAKYSVMVRSGMAHGPTFDPFTLDLTVGQWVIATVDWLPEYSIGSRNMRRYMQIASIADVSIAQRRLVLIDGGPVLGLGGGGGSSGDSDEEEEDVLPSPIIDYLVQTEDQRVQIDVDFPVDAPVGYQVRVDFVISDAEPAESSGLWELAGYLNGSGSVFTSIIPSGSTVWARARGELMGHRPTPWTVAETIVIPDTPGLLLMTLDFFEFGLIRMEWEPNAFAEGLRLEISTGLIGHNVSFSAVEDVDSDSPLIYDFDSNVISYGEEAYVRVTAYPGFSAGSVSGSPGSTYVQLIERPFPSALGTHEADEHFDTNFGSPDDRSDGDVVTWDSYEGTFVLAPAPGASPSTGYDEGTGFPGSPSTDDKFYRTDRNILYFYDGTRWLSTNLYTFYVHGVFGVTSTTNGTLIVNPWCNQYAMYVETFRVAQIISPGTGNWTSSLTGQTAGSAASLLTGTAFTNTNWDTIDYTINATIASTVDGMYLTLTENSGTGTGNSSPCLVYRLIG